MPGLTQVGNLLQGRYVIERELGRGGMATVYLAQDRQLHRPVALKLLHPELAATLGPERFQREIAIASRLSHVHILPLYDSGSASGRLFYAMPYVEGESLRQRLQREPQLPVEEAVSIARAVAAALDYAHRAGIIHRDIKPENILLARDPGGGPARAWVADFGMARAVDAAGGERLTETGLALGTPSYMSPEQAAAGRLDGRSDLYALGCVVYEMLAGVPPFTGPTAQAIMARHAVDPVPALRTVRATVPEAVAYAIERALAKVPADRFATTADFAEALIAPCVPPTSTRVTGWRRGWRPLAIGAVAGAALLATGFGVYRVRKPFAPSVMPAAATLAVLPFASGTTDTALTRLGRDLAVTVSASLDGVGGLQTSDRLSIATATVGQSAMSAAEGAALARRMGATSMLRGTLVRAGDNVRLDAGLYRLDGLAPLAEGITVTAHRDSVGALTDSVAWALLRQIWQRGTPPSPSLAEVTTHSLPAMRSFLEGERALGANQWGKAGLAFRSAIAADSTFWLAAFRSALTQWWSREPAGPEVMESLRAHRHLLSERERLLLEAFLTSETTPRLRIQRFKVATDRFPEYWPGWFLFADALYHAGPVVGYDWTEGLQAFQRVVTLNPKLVPAWEHMRDLALGRNQTVVSKAQAQLEQLGWPSPSHPAYRMSSLTSRFDPGVSAAGGVIPSSLGAVADSLAHYMVSTDDEDFGLLYGPLGTLQRGFPAAQIDLNRRALGLRAVSPRKAGALQRGNAWAWVTRGQWDSGLTIMSRLVSPDSITPDGALIAQESYQMAVLGAWLGITTPVEADRRRVIAVSILRQLEHDPDDDFGLIRMAWLDGLLGAAREDRRAIKAAQAVAAKGHYGQSDLVARSLGAFDLALGGDRKGAARELVRLEEYCIDHENCNSMLPHIAVQRLAAAQWLLETGDPEQASRLLRWQDTPWLGRPWTVGDALSGPTYLLRAHIEEARRRPRAAREYYEQFLRRYDRPMPSQAHLVEEARTALLRPADATEPSQPVK